MKKKDLPENIAIFPLSNAVFFPRTILPLNIFEDRYIELINDCLKKERMFGMVQPKSKTKNLTDVHNVGCLGKIINFSETADKRFIITLSGIVRFKIKKELSKDKLYRKFNVDYSDFLNDLNNDVNEIINFDRSNLLKKVSIFFNMINYSIRDNELSKLNLDQLVSTITMISPFSVEEKQKIIETIEIEEKIKLLDNIINFNIFELQDSKTIQ
jgi:uncharacterized protein